MLLFLCLCLSVPPSSQALFPPWTHQTSVDFQSIAYKQGKPAPTLPGATRYLEIRIESADAKPIDRAAFELKQWITSLKAQRPGLQVALQATQETLDALGRHELAGYVEGYSYRDQPYIPETDASAKLWLHSAANKDVLSALLDAQALACGLVIFDQPLASPELKEVLALLSALDAVDLDLQPDLSGLPAGRAHMFLNPKNGDHYLYLEHQAGDPKRLRLPHDLASKATCLYPKDHRFSFRQEGEQGELVLEDHSTYALFLLKAAYAQSPETLTVQRASTIDPYELVAANQVFRKRSREHFQSMIATESLHVYPLSPDQQNFTWVERIVMREGKPTEHHDLAFLINGIPYPQNKQREEFIIGPGRFNADVLDIKLDLNYQYSYLGVETVEGKACDKVAYQPKTVGNLTHGFVYFERESKAQVKMDVIQVQPDAPFTTFEYSVYFAWKTEGEQRFYLVDRIEGKAVLSAFGFSEAYRFALELKDFQFNSPQAETLVHEAYQSGLRIIRETENGPRYMVKPDHKATRKRHAHVTAVEDTSERVMIEPNVFASEKALVLGAAYDANSGDVDPLLWFDYTNLDFLGKGYYFYAGPGVVAFSNPSLWGSKLSFSTFAAPGIPDEDKEYRTGVAIEGTELKTSTSMLGFNLATPLGKYFTLKGTYDLSYNSFKRSKHTAENYVVPKSTTEHGLQLDLGFHTRKIALNGYYRSVLRDNWQAWGFDGQEPLSDRYDLAGLSLTGSFDFKTWQSIGYALELVEGRDLDRFSLLELGTEASVAGYGDIFRFERASTGHLSYSSNFMGLPINLGLDAGHLWLPEYLGDEVDLVGLKLGTLINGPWKTDIGLDFGFGLYSSQKLENTSLTVALSFHRRL